MRITSLSLLAGLALLAATPVPASAQYANPYFQQDYRDRGAGYVATGRARHDFEVARRRAARGNYYGADVAARRGRIERSRADADVRAANRNRFYGRMTE